MSRRIIAPNRIQLHPNLFKSGNVDPSRNLEVEIKQPEPIILSLFHREEKSIEPVEEETRNIESVEEETRNIESVEEVKQADHIPDLIKELEQIPMFNDFNPPKVDQPDHIIVLEDDRPPHD